MRALVVGLNEYPGMPLSGCVNDAMAIGKVLQRNADNSANFDVRISTAAEDVTLSEIRRQIKELYASPTDIALFYFAGHGTVLDGKAYLCTSDLTDSVPGLRMEDLIQQADLAASKIQNRIILLDCCFSGHASNLSIFNQTVSTALLSHGMTILTASRESEVSNEIGGHGVFTFLMLDALNGAAADILGRVTPASVYSHIDQSLGDWDQRPLFKSHVDRFLVLRRIRPMVSLDALRALPKYFPESTSVYALTPAHEHTNNDGTPKSTGDSALHSEFRGLQDCNRAGLVVPIGYKDMYWAAMNSTGCQLTALGRHYRRLALDGRF